jgi:hypothetical protein
VSAPLFVEVGARIVSLRRTFAIAKAEDCSLYISPRLFPMSGLHMGEEIIVAYDPLQPVEPGQRPRAVRIRRLA